MILLGVNCGFGNHDCGTLPLSALDLKGGWINYPRPKTAIERRCPLWPETVAALREAIDRRAATPKDPAHERLVFITKYGGSWAKDTPRQSASAQGDAEAARQAEAAPARAGVLRACGTRSRRSPARAGTRWRSTRSWGTPTRRMAAHYRERISDERLRDAVNVVRKWLFRRESSTPWRAGRGKKQ